MHTLSIATPALSAPSFLDRNARLIAISAFALLALLMLFAPDTAHAAAGQLSAKGATAVAWIRIAVGVILTIAVMGSGVMAAFGQMSWKTVGQVLVGCIVAGLATVVVTALFGT
jgi:TrbC/VIRB2 family pilin